MQSEVDEINKLSSNIYTFFLHFLVNISREKIGQEFNLNTFTEIEFSKGISKTTQQGQLNF